MARPKKTTQVPESTRCVVYARVSTKEQSEEGYSLEAQLGLLRAYASRQGFEIVSEFVESETAKKAGRTEFGKMLSLIRSEGIGVILAEKTDRLYRNLTDYVKVDDLQNVSVHFVKEGEIYGDGDNSDHRFMHGIKVLIARKYSENLSEETKKGMREKARQGIWPSVAPLGYRNVAAGARRHIEPDPSTADAVRDMLVAYASGKVSLRKLKEYAYARGLRSRSGGKIPTSSLHLTLNNPLYCGIVRWDGVDTQGVHAPLITKEVWERIQEVMSGRNETKEKPSSAREFIYRGLFRCGVCGCLMSAQSTKGHVYYACSGAKGCPRKTIREEDITQAVAERLSGTRIKPEVLDSLRRALESSAREEELTQSEDRKALEAEEAELRRRLQRLYLDRVAGTVPEIVYPGLKAEWEGRQGEIELELRAFDRARSAFYAENVSLLEFASNAYSRFKEASKARQREMAENLLSNCTVTEGNIQVSFHEAFEMVLEANVRMAEKGAENDVLKIWLPAMDSNHY